MLAPEEKKDVECRGRSEDEKALAQKLRNQFKFSGLYLSENIYSPLWKVNWYSHLIFVANDGKHVIRAGPWASSPSDEALSFIENGDILKTYKVEDLITEIATLPHSTSHFEWKKELAIKDETKTFVATTLEDKTFVFNFETGEIVNRSEKETQGNNKKTFCGGSALLWVFALCLIFRR
jgi:hypothetical protein